MKTKLKKAPAKKATIKRAPKKQITKTIDVAKKAILSLYETPIKRGPGRPRKVITEVVKKHKVINIVPIITTSTNNNIKIINFGIPGDKSGARNYVYVYDAPTGSCQLFSAAYFQNLKWLDLVAKLKYKTKPFKIDYRPVITAMRRSVYTKNLLFIDVKSTLTPFIKELFTEEQIISETPYKSTNSSNMVLYTINVREFV